MSEAAPGELSQDEILAVRFPPILQPYHGQRPPAPAWFEHAIEQRPGRTTVEVDGAALELLAWGERGKPGLLFLHGNGAHADWWSFIAPFFADQYRCAALSWSGMGRSGWREAYSMEGFQREALAVSEAAGLFEAEAAPVVIAHSLGGAICLYLAAAHGERFKGAMILDSGARPPGAAWRGPKPRTRPTKVYPTLEEALAGFRLMPPQDCRNHYLVDYIARESLHPAPLDDGSGQNGWTWRFDPFLSGKLAFSQVFQSGEEVRSAKCPLAFVWGEQSLLVSDQVIDYSRRCAPTGTPFVAIPEAHHHIMLDQPLALVATLRALLAGWEA